MRSANCKQTGPTKQDSLDEVETVALPSLEKEIYLADPDFRPYPPALSTVPTWAPESPLDREILRRLLFAARKHGIRDIAMLLRRLPVGLDLPEPQKALLRGCLPNEKKLSSTLEALWPVDYVSVPPSIEEFLSAPEYLGGSFSLSGQAAGLWPEWQTLLAQDFDLDAFIHNLVVTGAIGIGKTLVMCVLVLYRLCVIAHLRDPGSFFGLSSGGAIHFVVLSASLDTLRATAWARLARCMSVSPFFSRLGYVPDAKDYKLSIELLSLPGNGYRTPLQLCGGSRSRHLLGRDALVIAMDEANFRPEAKPHDAAFSLFTDIRARMASRFQLRRGFMPGLSIVASSAIDESAFTERLIREVRTSQSVAEVEVRRAIYQVKPGQQYKDWWFRVAHGRPNSDPKILSGAVDSNGCAINAPFDCPALIGGKHEDVPEGMVVELVPGDYFEQFQRNPRHSLQHFSGIATGGTYRLFSTLGDIERCLVLSKAEGFVNPSSAKIIPVSDEDSTPILKALNHGCFVTRQGNEFVPKINAASLRFAHLDLATTGKAGLAICHLAPRLESQLDDKQGLVLQVIVNFDLILTFGPGRDRPIAFDKIREFILWLRKSCGYHFAKVTADNYQSDYLLQTLEANGIATGKLSIDRSPDAYHALRAGFQAGAIRLHEQEEFLTEAAQLLEIGGKVDHPQGASKDTSDAVAGAYFGAINSDQARQLAARHDAPLHGVHANVAQSASTDPFGMVQRVSARKPRQHRLS